MDDDRHQRGIAMAEPGQERGVPTRSATVCRRKSQLKKSSLKTTLPKKKHQGEVISTLFGNLEVHSFRSEKSEDERKNGRGKEKEIAATRQSGGRAQNQDVEKLILKMGITGGNRGKRGEKKQQRRFLRRGKRETEVFRELIDREKKKKRE